MKKIGLLSVYNHNYGSLLQTYALQTFLNNNGYTNEILIYKKSKILQLKRLTYLPLLMSLFKNKSKIIFFKLFHKEMYDVLITRERKMADFVKEKLIFSTPYFGKKDLIKGCNNYSQFIVGSDQVWHPINLGSDFFTMNFIPYQYNKISYASSFGINSIPFYFRKKYGEYLNRINHISVRELNAVKIVKTLSNKKAVHVVDPTLLLNENDWDKVCNDKVYTEKKYVFCYFIGKNKQYREIVKNYCSVNDLRIIGVPHVDEYVKSDNGFSDILLKDMGISEFLELIKNAEYIFTDSFHATIFSIVFKKSFVVFPRFRMKNKKSTNSRIVSLLNMIDCSDRLCCNGDIENILKNNIDYDKVKNKIEKMRSKSIEFLSKSIIK